MQQGCIKHGRNFLNHIDKHHIEKEVAEKVEADVDKDAKPSGAVAVNDIKLPKLMIPPCEQYKIVAGLFNVYDIIIHILNLLYVEKGNYSFPFLQYY